MSSINTSKFENTTSIDLHYFIINFTNGLNIFAPNNYFVLFSSANVKRLLNQ